jgi:predicted nucleotidyltransferase
MSNDSALMDVLFPAARQRVLAVLLLQPQASFHLRELARLAHSHAGTLTRELDKLTQAGLLLRTEQGNQVRYQADGSHPLFEDLAAMFRKTHGVVQMLKAALAPLDGRFSLVLVFGSVARGAETAGSDVDLLVLGELGFAELVQALHPLQEALRREINPVPYAPQEFAARARRGDAFALDLLGKPKLWVKGTDDDLAELVGDQAAARAPR